MLRKQISIFTTMLCVFPFMGMTCYAQHNAPQNASVHQQQNIDVLPPNTDPEIIGYFKKAKEGSAKDQLTIGIAYDMGIGLPQDSKKAIYWYEKAANQGVEDAQYNLGILYEFGLGIPEDPSKAAFWYEKSAQQGNPEAQIILGVMYYEGNGVEENKVKAKQWLQKAADKGSSEAKYYLSQMQDFPQEKKLTITDTEHDEILKKDAAAGNKEAQQELKILSGYEEADAIDEHVHHWFEDRAAQGDVNAQYALGVIYLRGLNVPVDNVKAAKWLDMAAKQGSVGAKYELGMLYFQGKGVKQDLKLAKEYFKQSCEDHIKEACQMYNE